MTDTDHQKFSLNRKHKIDAKAFKKARETIQETRNKQYNQYHPKP